MKLEVGKKIKGREIVFVSDDGNIWATYEQFSLGAKGKIWGEDGNTESYAGRTCGILGCLYSDY